MSIKSLGKQTLIYGFGHVMVRLVTFLLLPLYTNTFTQEAYGTLSLAYAFMGFALIIYKYGMDTALMKYAVQESDEKRIRYITVIFLSQVTTGILFSFVLIMARGSIAEHILGVYRPDWIIYLAIILFLDSLWHLPLLILRAEERATFFIFLSLVNVIATMVFNIVFVVYIGNGIEGVFTANLIASGLILIFSLPVILKRIKIDLFHKATFKEVLKFALPFLPAGIFTMVMELSDRYLLEWFLGTSEVGIYSAGKKMGMLGLTVVMGFNMGWTPYFLKRGKEKGAKSEFSKITTFFLGIMGYASLLVSMWVSEIMRISFNNKNLIGSEFWGCEPVVGIILVAYFFFGTYVIQLPGVYMKEITNWVPIFRINGALVLIFSSLILIPNLGLLGAAYAVVLGFFAMSITIYIKTFRIYPIIYNLKGIIYPTVFLIAVQIGIDNLFIKLFISILYPILWYLIVPNEQEKTILRKMFL